MGHCETERACSRLFQGSVSAPVLSSIFINNFNDAMQNMLIKCAHNTEIGEVSSTSEDKF